MICHSAIEKRPLVEWPAFFAGRIETKGAVEILAMTLARDFEKAITSAHLFIEKLDLTVYSVYCERELLNL